MGLPPIRQVAVSDWGVSRERTDWVTESEEEPRGSVRRLRVLLADDHRLVREGLAGLLEGRDDIEVVGMAENGLMAIEMTRELEPDVVLMDITMPQLNGIDATSVIKEEMPHVRVVGLSMHQRDDMAEAMFDAGASAYLTKGGPTEELLEALRG